MIQLQVTKIVRETRGTTLELHDVDGIVSRLEIYCPAPRPEYTTELAAPKLEALHAWAQERKLGDEIEIAVPWTHEPVETLA